MTQSAFSPGQPNTPLLTFRLFVHERQQQDYQPPATLRTDEPPPQESIKARHRVFAESHGAPLVPPPWLLCFRPPPTYYLRHPGARQTQSTPHKLSIK